MPPACPGEFPVFGYTRGGLSANLRIPSGGEAAAGNSEGFLELLFVVKTVTIPRASRGHSSNLKVNTNRPGFRLVLGRTQRKCSSHLAVWTRGFRRPARYTFVRRVLVHHQYVVQEQLAHDSPIQFLFTLAAQKPPCTVVGGALPPRDALQVELEARVFVAQAGDDRFAER